MRPSCKINMYVFSFFKVRVRWLVFMCEGCAEAGGALPLTLDAHRKIVLLQRVDGDWFWTVTHIFFFQLPERDVLAVFLPSPCIYITWQPLDSWRVLFLVLPAASFVNLNGGTNTHRLKRTRGNILGAQIHWKSQAKKKHISMTQNALVGFKTRR